MDPIFVLLAASGGLVMGGGIGWWMGSQSSAQALETNLKKSREEAEELNSQLTRSRGAADRSQNELADIRRQFGEIKANADRYLAVREKFEMARGVHKFYQPVLLVGPIASGKTSLLWQWQAPWEPAPKESTINVKQANVTLYSRDDWMKGPHAYDDSVAISYEAHLMLRVFDFPGELTKQAQVAATLAEQTKELKAYAERVTKEENRARIKKLGIVVICMLDCGALTQYWANGDREALEAHISYYNAALFKELKRKIAEQSVDIDHVVLVFNKFDLVRQFLPDKSDHDRLLACRSGFDKAGVTEFLTGTVHRSRMPHVPSVLNPTDLTAQIQGATTIRKFAGKSIVEAILGDVTPAVSSGGAPGGAPASEFVFIMQ